VLHKESTVEDAVKSFEDIVDTNLNVKPKWNKLTMVVEYFDSVRLFCFSLLLLPIPEEKFTGIVGFQEVDE